MCVELGELLVGEQHPASLRAYGIASATSARSGSIQPGSTM
jgi:hypothetical protein